MSFETSVELGIEIDNSDLRAAKRTIEDEIGDVTVGVESGGSRATSSGGGSAAGATDQQNRRMFRWARQRTNSLDEAVSILSNIEDALDEGGGGLLGGGGGDGGGGGFPTIIPLGGGGGGRLPGPGGAGGLGGILRNFAMSTGVLAQPFVNNQMQVTDESSQELANRGPVQSFFADLGATLGINQAGDSFVDQAAGGNQSAQRQRNAELLRRQQQMQLTQPQWMRDFLSGNADPPEWIERGPSGLFDTPSGQRAPDRPGGAERVRINFEQTVEAQGFTPEELEDRIDGKLQEFEREIARETGRGLGGTPIP